ncbi:MAG TPA: Gfo/Idh/MocA family oxidoreductase, partial [Thermomicrobiales bacterium]|nr:Gfo/Idh/MocA family oxidoreductase [Thermomicrobiales bacterium]
ASIGMVGVNTSHADQFLRILNGSEREPALVDNSPVIAIWGNDDPTRVQELAGRHGVPELVTDPTEMIGKVDGVLIIDDTGGGESHPELAMPFLEAGVPTFIDKPMALSWEAANRLFETAEQHGAPLFSASALAFAVEREAFQAELDRIGTLSSVMSVGPGDWFYYGVHAVEMLGTVVNAPATRVHRHAYPDRDIVIVEYDGGPSAVVETLRDAAYVFHLTAYGAEGHASMEVQDALGFYTNTMRKFAEMVRTGTAPIPAGQTLDVLAILEAGNRSAERGAAVDISEIAGAQR